MQINGKWSWCDDGILRPLLVGDIQTVNGSWELVEFLVDTGADRTVLNEAVFSSLGLTPMRTQEAIGGLGGTVDSVVIETRIRFLRDTGEPLSFRGKFTAVTATTALDISVLGRDILDLFAVMVDRPSDVVCLLRPRHYYTIEER
ncbi:MAG: aspartyl protease family protein [Acidobacteria bacterium]|nr:aspartyl protease family protein [Acidobacteriota bacterium]